MRRIGVEGDPLVRVAQDEIFGHYQSNAAMSAAKATGGKPRDVAVRIVEALDAGDLCDPPEIAGPGFINFRVKPGFLSDRLSAVPATVGTDLDRLGIPPAENPQTVVVDLSSPNLAKEMHIGHLRSTVIGDCIARLLEFEGHTVIRENHVGDWGTQFGMLLAHLRRTRPEQAENPDRLEIKDLELFYLEARTKFDADESFQEEARKTVVALQQGDPGVRKIWRAFCDESLRHCHQIYNRLGVRLIDRGESFYTDLMNEVIARLEQRRQREPDGMVRESDGALCLFLPGFTTREGEPLPLIVRKSDGGFNYATSDLATILHRVERLHATRIIYVVGLSQKQHFEMIFSAARRTGWVNDNVSLEHLGFGNVLASSGKPFKTREGGTVKLADILEEAVARAARVITEHDSEDSSPPPKPSPDPLKRIAEKIGLAAVKYFDLSHSLSSDYRFVPDVMLSLEGNTAPYMLYAYARIRSIGRKAGIEFENLSYDSPILLEHPAEVALGLKILQFAETLESAARELRPNLLTDYLYDLSRVFSRFYDRKLGVRVIDASPESVRLSRLRLCDLTARTLKLVLYLLGIDTVDQM